MNFLLKNVLQKIYKPIYSDMRLMEEILKNSLLDWTIVRAPKLTDGKQTGKYKNITGLPLHGIPKISRADLAACMLTHLTDEQTFKKTIDVAY
ncbi:MAG: family oxidoreductase [Chitinophagaceae bacterium]|nr:family oxidoreductase [Chitinophagaceae bacterium]